VCCSCSAVLRLGPNTSIIGNSARQVCRVAQLAAGCVWFSNSQTRSYSNGQHCLSNQPTLRTLLLLHRLVGCSCRASWTT
jgi:hypothetical protein